MKDAIASGGINTRFSLAQEAINTRFSLAQEAVIKKVEEHIGGSLDDKVKQHPQYVDRMWHKGLFNSYPAYFIYSSIVLGIVTLGLDIDLNGLDAYFALSATLVPAIFGAVLFIAGYTTTDIEAGIREVRKRVIGNVVLCFDDLPEIITHLNESEKAGVRDILKGENSPSMLQATVVQKALKEARRNALLEAATQ